MSTRRTLKTRALLLALLMTLSVVAIGGSAIGGSAIDGGAIDGSAAADATAHETAAQDGANPIEVHVDDLDERLIWQGQELRVTGLEPQTDYQLRRVIDADRSAFVREYRADGDGTITMETERFDPDEYFLQGGDHDRDTSQFEVVVQRLTVTWADQEITRAQHGELQFDSSRLTYQVEVSADGLRYRHLVDMFDEADFAADHDAERDDNVLILHAPARDDALRVDFSDVPRGTYELRIDVRDSTASATTTMRVGQPQNDGDIEIGEPDEPTPTPTPEPDEPTPDPDTPTPEPDEVTPTPTPEPDEPTPEPDEVTPTPTPEPEQPGFGVLLGVLAILGAALVAVRSRRRRRFQ